MKLKEIARVIYTIRMCIFYGNVFGVFKTTLEVSSRDENEIRKTPQKKGQKLRRRKETERNPLERSI